MTESAALANREFGSQFDESYYASHCGPVPYTRSEPQWAVVFAKIADQLIQSLAPRRVLDVGCALGFLVEAFWDRGVEAWGVDISPYAVANVRSDVRNYCRLGSAAEPIENGPFDLVTCIEVLEHMPEQEALLAIRHMTQACDTILFSSSPYDFEEPTHINVKPALYWLQSFEEHGFSPDLLFDAGFVCPHAMLLRRTHAPPDRDVLRLFGNMLHLRHLLTERTNQYNESARDLGIAQQDLGIAQQERHRISAEFAREMEKLRAELRDANSRAESKESDLHNALAELQATKDALAQANEMQSQIREDLDAAASQIAACLRNDLDKSRSSRETATELAGVQDRLNLLEHHVLTLGNTVANMLNSRIWRTLMRGGAVLQKLLPGGNR